MKFVFHSLSTAVPAFGTLVLSGHFQGFASCEIDIYHDFG